METCSSTSSETGREALTSSSSAESTDSQTDHSQLITDHSVNTPPHDQSELMTGPGDNNHHQNNNDPDAAGHHAGETKEEYNNNVITREALQYVIVADNLREPKLVVLDNTGDTGDTPNDNTDNKVATTPTSDRSSLQMTQTR